MRRILVAEDEAHVARLLRIALNRAGYAVETARDGEEALARARARPPDVLLTDIQMPRMDGRELSQRIRAELPGDELLILVATSRAEDEHRHWVAQLPAVELIEKPVSLRRLIQRIDAHFHTAGEAPA